MTNRSVVTLTDGHGHTNGVSHVPDLLECVAAFGRSLDRSFHPAQFLSDLSARAQSLVPHDYMLIQRREGDGHTCSTLAECAVRGPLLGQRTHYTTSFERGVRVPAEVFALRPVFEGHTQIIADMTTDPRFAEDSAWGTKLAMAELRRAAGSTRFARLAATGPGFERIGWIGHSLPADPATTTIEDFSVAERVSRAEAVLIRDANRELDPRRSGDRRMIDGGDQSILCVPLLFGERVGGFLLFASKQAHWYDESDLEIGSTIAAALVIATRTSRLADRQQGPGGGGGKKRKAEREGPPLR